MNIREVIAVLHRMQTDGVLDNRRFREILARHGLITVWQRFERQFLEPTS